MPLDLDTMKFLVKEAVDTALQDTKEKLNELSMKYHLKITVKPPILVELESVEKGEVIWQD
ncbi:MAG: hypothetical protein FK731_03175 [Asgard group archaeon]|nr:hypothetical protein [Asgard group archaeon]